MSIFGRFEKKVEGAVNGVFARAFKGDVQPVEIAARLQKELDTEAKLMSRDKRLVPNEFAVGLSPHDHDKLSPYAKTLSGELAAELKAHAREQGYTFNGPIRIHFDRDDELPTGRFTVASEATSAATSAASVGVRGPRADVGTDISALDRDQLVLEVNGMRHTLEPPGFVIGRGTEADLRINDPGISRQHAEIRVSTAGGAVQAEIVDLGSTNGMLVNGHKVGRADLRHGTRIEMGSTRMLVHAPAGR